MNNRLDIEAMLQPSLIAAFQQAYVADSLFSELQRHTGASSFVWSRTVQDNFAISWNLLMPAFQIG